MEAISHAGTVLAVLSKEGIAMAAEKVSRARCYPHSFGTTSGPCKHETPQCNGLGQQFAEHVANTVAESHWRQGAPVWEARAPRRGWAVVGRRSSC
jgi:hypothetical protein